MPTEDDLCNLERAMAQASPAGFATIASNGKWVSAPHLRLIDNLLIRIAKGEVTRVIVSLPPRHGKSELISVYTPAWYLGMHPDRRVILASYEADFAAQWGRRARSLLSEFGGLFPEPVAVSPDSSSASRWDIDKHTGGMQTTGIGGPLTGKGAHLAIIDDPIKNSEEASSETVREKQWEWFKSTFYTRLEPGGAILLIMTRWNEGDLAGKIKTDMESLGGEKWEIVSLPAIAEGDDVLGRERGEALWPERYPIARLLEIKRTLGSYWFAGLYQQRPAPLEGGMFKRHWFKMVEDWPRQSYQIRYWDLAATSGKKSDWTCGLLMAEVNGQFWLVDMQRIRENPAGVERLIRSTAVGDGPDVAIQIEQEPGSSGLNTIDHYARYVLKGFIFKGDKVTGDKAERARAISAAAEAGNVFIVRGEWNEAFFNEVMVFPNGEHDDQVDVLSGAHSALTIGGFARGSLASTADAIGEKIDTPTGFWTGDIPTL